MKLAKNRFGVNFVQNAFGPKKAIFFGLFPNRNIHRKFLLCINLPYVSFYRLQ